MNYPIIGIGELLWDVYPNGRRVAGGAPFNFAFHCHQLGHPAAIVSRVGNDDLGRELRTRVRELGMTDEYIQTDRNHPTGTVKVTLDANKVPTYTISENTAWDHLEWDEKLADRSTRLSAVCFGTLAQRSPASRAVIRRFTLRDDGLLPTRPVRVCDLNLRSPYYDRNLVRETLAHCDWVKLNGDELEELVGMVPLAQLTTRSPAIQLRVVYDLRLVCVTHGSEGVFLAWEGGELAVPGVPADVVDTVGAGDAFTAALLCLHLEGRPFRDCARFAVRYAARVCEFPESTPRIDRAAVERDVAGSRS